MAEKYILYYQSRNVINPNTTRYVCNTQLYPTCGRYDTETELGVRYIATRAGTLSKLVCHSDTPAGVGLTITFTLRINGVNTALTCQLTGAVAYDCSDLVHTAAVAVGDRITLQVVTSAGVNYPIVEGSVEFDS